jgi:hypothetical protein
MHEATRAHNRLNDFDNDIADALTGVGEQLFGGELLLFQDGSARLVEQNPDENSATTTTDFTGGAKKKTLGTLVDSTQLTRYKNGVVIEESELFKEPTSLYCVTYERNGQLFTSNPLYGETNKSTEDNVGDDEGGADNGQGDADNGQGDDTDNGQGDDTDNGQGDDADNGQGDDADNGEGGGEIPGELIDIGNLRCGRPEDGRLYLREVAQNITLKYNKYPLDFSDEDKSGRFLAMVVTNSDDTTTTTRYTVDSVEMFTTEDGKFHLTIPIASGDEIYICKNLTKDVFHRCQVLSDVSVEIKVEDGYVTIMVDGTTVDYDVNLDGTWFNKLTTTSSIQEGLKRRIQFRHEDFISIERDNGELMNTGLNGDDEPFDVDLEISNTAGYDYRKNTSVSVSGMAIPYNLKRALVVGDENNEISLIPGLSDKFEDYIVAPRPNFRIRIENSDGDDVSNLFQSPILEPDTGNFRLVPNSNANLPDNFNGWKMCVFCLNADMQPCFETVFPIDPTPISSRLDLSSILIENQSRLPDTLWALSDITGWSFKYSCQQKVGVDSWELCSEDEDTYERGTSYRRATLWRYTDESDQIIVCPSSVERIPMVVPSVLSSDNLTVTGQDGILRHRELEAEQTFYVANFGPWSEVQVTGGPNNATDLLVYVDAGDGNGEQNLDGKFELTLENVGYTVTVQLKTPDNRILHRTWQTELTIDVNTYTNVEGRAYVGERIRIDPSDSESNGSMFRIMMESNNNDDDDANTTSNLMSEMLVDQSMNGQSFRLTYVNPLNDKLRGTSRLYTVSNSCDIDLLSPNLAQINVLVPVASAGDLTPQLRTATLDVDGNDQWSEWSNNVEIALTGDTKRVQAQMVGISDLTTSFALPSIVYDTQ